jgi:uncharacterized protein
MKFILPLAVALALCSPIEARADQTSHRAAAEALLSGMEMDKVMSQTIDQMLKLQIQQNPTIAPYEPQMRAFFAKYMSWASMKNDLVGFYVAEFSEDELKQMNAFYQTPVGKKAVQKMPILAAKGAELGQKRVQEHLPELQAAISGQAGDKKKP